jgi:heterodisulfide reductase subunit C
MNDFGYTIHKDATLDLDHSDMRLVREVLKNEPSLHKCIQCGGCSSTCSAGAFTNFNFRKIHLMLRRGNIVYVQKAIEKCMLCGKCMLVCPRGVNTRNVILQIKLALTKLKEYAI